MNRRPWVKLWADCLDSRQLAKAGEAAEVLFYRLLTLNGKEGSGDTLALSAEDIAWRMRLSVEDVERRLSALVSAGLIEMGDGIAFPGWAERQAEKSDAERQASLRARKRTMSRDSHATVTRQTCDTSRDCRILESESESESEEEPRTQPTATSSEAEPPATRSVVRVVKPAATDEPLKALLDAWNTATGDRLVWSAKYFQPTEAAHRLGATPELLARAAKAYTAALDTGTRSFPRFCADFDRWLSAANAPPKPKKPDRRDDPRLGSPSPAARNVFTTPESVLAARGARDEF